MSQLLNKLKQVGQVRSNQTMIAPVSPGLIQAESGLSDDTVQLSPKVFWFLIVLICALILCVLGVGVMTLARGSAYPSQVVKILKKQNEKIKVLETSMAELQDKQGQQYQGLESSLKVVMQQVQKDIRKQSLSAHLLKYPMDNEAQDRLLTGPQVML